VALPCPRLPARALLVSVARPITHCARSRCLRGSSTHQERAANILRVIDGAALRIHLWNLLHGAAHQFVQIAQLELMCSRFRQAGQVGDSVQRGARCERMSSRRLGHSCKNGEAPRRTTADHRARAVRAAFRGEGRCCRSTIGDVGDTPCTIQAVSSTSRHGDFGEETKDRNIHVLPSIATGTTVIDVHPARRRVRPEGENEAKLTRPNRDW
jgi:hypothetical protein